MCPREPATANEEDETRPSMWRRLGKALKVGLGYDLNNLFRQHREVDAGLLEEIETLLLCADVGVEATARIVSALHKRLARNELHEPAAVRQALREKMLDILRPVCVPLRLPAPTTGTFVVLVVGVNGSGKTTSIGKLARLARARGHSVMLAAGDTFRAAAVEQLQVWGTRIGVPIISQHPGADSASVIFDALHSARAHNTDLLIADTAGRLHTHDGLMEELKKVRRVMTKLDPDAPHETMLVLDGSTGQNALTQAARFHEAVDVSGVTLTKLDGTAKGGIVFAIAERLRLPIRFVGIGEGADDLREFDADAFVDGVLSA